MKAFFKYFGGKTGSAKHYPAPRHETIIEPFAGAAGYSVNHFESKIILIEKDPKLAATWQYLISSQPKEILDLPLIELGQTVDDFKICQEAKWLIGMWMSINGDCQPTKKPGVWHSQKLSEGYDFSGYWGDRVRFRVALQSSKIKHWKIIAGTYEDAPDIEATWFIDPPYEEAGKAYKFGSKDIDFERLGSWCKERKGQVMVCENMGAKWLPFRFFKNTRSNKSNSGRATSAEAIWTSGC